MQIEQLTIEEAVEVRQKLLELLDAGDPVSIAVAGRIDCAGRQLLCALHREALLRGCAVDVSFASEGSAITSECAIKRDGNRCLWPGEKE